MSMIPEASTHLIISEAIEDLIPDETVSIEAYAEGLIDDLFTDIDTILDSGRKHPAKTLRTEYASMQAVAVKMQEVVLPPTVNRSVTTISSIPNQQPTSTLVFNPPSVTAIRKRKQKNSGGLNNLLILGSTLSMAVIGAAYLTEAGIIKSLTSNTHTNQIQSAAVVPADPWAELVDYMLEALAVIDQQDANNQQKNLSSKFGNVNNNLNSSLPLPSNPSLGTLTPPVSANNLPPVPSRVTNVVERIYVPVYQSPPSVRPLPEVANSPAQISPPEFVNENTQNQRPATKPVPVKPPVATKLPTIAPPKLPTATASAPTTTQDIYLPAYSAQLEGLMELGQKSAALFKIDGVTSRINLGENIGATGWTLVDVSNGEAIIRRNGEVRSIYTGQKL
ncbi:hypothetical protein WJM97_07455 [Okeanomitos corallinicola TIOX110]|uniref:Type II secretion system protein GspC N-terminal domain-containing protein n=1 Tax=Okeanomitos corallinicola TIOX110 TaxID=3133117 RepID=A0ABZ2UVU9_9CYAN